MGILSRISSWVATLGPLGYLPAPGTWGSVCALLVMYPLCMNLAMPYVYAIVLAITSLAFLAVHYALPEFDGNADPAQIVIDEFVGFAVLACVIPCTPNFFSLGLWVFRFFDILKPFGIKAVEERCQGTLGIMLDDLLAAAYAAIFMWVVFYIF